jgi:hypothetical protein
MTFDPRSPAEAPPARHLRELARNVHMPTTTVKVAIRSAGEMFFVNAPEAPGLCSIVQQRELCNAAHRAAHRRDWGWCDATMPCHHELVAIRLPGRQFASNAPEAPGFRQ